MNPNQLYLSLDGRIDRKTFWLRGVLLLFAVQIAAAIIDGVLGTAGVLALAVNLLVIYPALMVYAKRWHDRDKSAWWSLILLIPIIGALWFLVELGFLKGTDGPNRFGELDAEAA